MVVILSYALADLSVKTAVRLGPQVVELRNQPKAGRRADSMPSHADDNALDRDHGAGRVRDANGDLSAADALTKRDAVRVTTRINSSEALAWWPPLACFLDEVDEADEGRVAADPGREELAWKCRVRREAD
jgi:hypothetical protein